MRSTLFRSSPLLLFFTPALSWGNIGHRTIGYLSQMYMTQPGLEFFNKIINPSDDFDISDAAVWADYHRDGPWQYTYNWHFIDARDSPPSQCQVVYERDCDARDDCDTKKDPGCVVGAIAAQTSRVISGNNSEEAMKFLLHFVGDVHQPLHAENLDRGGNDICILWHKGRHQESHNGGDHSDRASGRRSELNADASEGECPPHKKCTNLHSAWDTLMIEKLINYQHPDRDHATASEKSAASQWAQALYSDTEGNPELDQDDCIPGGDSDKAVKCALSWASESNNYVCSYVLKDGVEGVEGQELSGDYYEGAVPIIKGQITRAARRFAAVVNALASSNGADTHRDDNQAVMNEL